MQKTANCSPDCYVVSFDRCVNDSNRTAVDLFGLPAQMLKIMRLLAFFIFVVSLAAHASCVSQTVTLSGRDLPLKQVFTAIKKQTGFSVFFNQELIALSRPVSFSVGNMPLQEFLSVVLHDQPLSYKIEDRTIFISRKTLPTASFAPPPVMLSSEQPPLLIHVKDADGNPLSGASVRSRKTKYSGVTNADGTFSLSVPIGDIIEVTYVGFAPQSFTIENTSFPVLDIRLTPNSVLEEAVVYNGYQKIQQKYLTGSVTSLKMDSIIQPGLNTIDKMLEGRVPGLSYMQNSGQAGAAPKLRIRGTSTILGSREPLWVVDGIIRTNPIPIPADRINDPDFVNLLGNAISGLNPYDIEQIDVLKDAAAAALYGVRAANGVIVITTKRGKPGPPTVNYNVTGTYTRRPRYTDRNIYMMNSQERVDVSREMIEKQLTLRGGSMEAYEKAIVDYYGGNIDYNTFQQMVDKAESINTDWLGNTMHDVFTTNHTLSISGGSPTASYRASVGYQAEPGVIKKESNNRYTGALNVQINYRKFKADFNIQMNKGKRRYTPSAVGVMDYAYGTSRAIPLYNEDGSHYFYSTISSSTSITSFFDLKTMNILNEIDRTGEIVETNDYTISSMLSYEIASGLQLNSTLGFTGGDSERQNWFEEQTEMAARIRNSSYKPNTNTFQESLNLLPFGGQLTHQTVRRQQYSINTRLEFNRYLDPGKKHHLGTSLGGEIISNKSNSFEQTSRGYYPNRGYSFAVVDIAKYTAYGKWMQQNAFGTIRKDLQNSLRSFLTATYVFDERFVVTASASQEFSNAFGSRSNEKFLPTWALSGRWNLQEDLFKNATWIDAAALKLSYGTQGNMLVGQTPYTIIQRGAMNTLYNSYGSNITSFPNPDLKWEKKEDYGASIEFSLLGERIRGVLGVFSNKTTNAFLEKKLSQVNGVQSYVVNGGTLQNYGVEVAMNFRIINSKGIGNKRGFMWRFDPQLGQAINKLINNNLQSRNVLVDAAALTFQDFLQGRVPINGRSINTFYSYQFKGLDPQFGYPVFYGAEPENATALAKQYNAMIREDVYSIVMVESGRREPVIQGGISNTFGYRSWTIDINVAYSVGNKIRLLQIASGNYGTFRPSSQQNLRREFVNRWRYPGDEQHTNIPAIQGAQTAADHQKTGWWNNTATRVTNSFATDYYQMYDFSDLRVVSGDYVKLQSLSLQYMVPMELCKKWGVKGVLARLTGNNLFTIANKSLRGQDPSQSGSAPNINLSIRPVYAFNINISL